MSIPQLEACKKRKRTTKFYGLHTFADPGCPINPSGPFRDNIRFFLRECAELKDYDVEGMPTWCTFLVHENRGFVVPLYTIEESVKSSTRPFCDHCRCAGWSNHFVSKRKYHMIIPLDDEWNKPLEDGVLDLQTHLLHGLIHCNGFGHLLCINGIDGGSRYLCGREVMDLWDRICTNLHARKITVEDSSKKRSMDLRLLHGVAYGHPWFGKWGYKFYRGSFGVTEHKYDKAVEILSSLELDEIIHNFRFKARGRDIKQIIQCYRNLSETQLATIRDLLKFMFLLKSRTTQRTNPDISVLSSSKCSARIGQKSRPSGRDRSSHGKCKNFSAVAANLDSRWPIRRLEYAANVVVDALKAKKASKRNDNSGMTRQEARDAARVYIGDTGLIDNVLKSMNNVIVGGYIVRRAVNKLTRVLEYSIQDLSHGSQIDSEPEMDPEPVPRTPTFISGTNVYGDISYMYDHVFFNYPNQEMVEQAVRAILNSKHLVKEWPFTDDPDHLLRFICRVMPSLRELDTEFSREYPPGEYIEVPLHSTVGDLKVAVEDAMRDTYCIMEKLVVTDVEDIERMEDGEVLFGVLESGSEICVRGYGIDLGSELKYQGGADNWTVRCRCGAQDDDGERMVACDICEIWQHTRCIGIEDSEVVPPLFVCVRCCASLAPQKTLPGLEYMSLGASTLPSHSDFSMELLTDYSVAAIPVSSICYY